jgi:glutamate/tyrosine decarboxylase-like PLP-dependent enzyme
MAPRRSDQPNAEVDPGAAGQPWGQQTATLLRATAERAIDFLGTLPERRVHPLSTPAELRAIPGGPLPDGGEAANAVLHRLAAAGERGVVASAGPRYFGFVVGGALPAALAADWMTSAWDQNAMLYATSPVAVAAEGVVGEWLVELCGLPQGSSVGFTTGCQMANFIGLADGRRAVLSRHGWDVEERGLQDAPRARVLVGEEAHVTIILALQLLGFGSTAVERVANRAGRDPTSSAAFSRRTMAMRRQSSARRRAT